MAKFLKGNYQLPKGKKVTASRRRSRQDLTSQFEESALAKLGGSLCFVMKKNTFIWTEESGEASRT